MIRPFHLALPTKSVQDTIAFYEAAFDIRIGRSDTTWVDFDFYGHQLVFHESPNADFKAITNPVDGKIVRVPHFGVILSMTDWIQLKEQLEAQQMNFIIEPYTRFKGTPGEQATMFFEDNNGYAIEMKAFEDDRFIFEPFAE